MSSSERLTRPSSFHPVLDALKASLVMVASLWILIENEIVYQVRGLALIIVLLDKVAS